MYALILHWEKWPTDTMWQSKWNLSLLLNVQVSLKKPIRHYYYNQINMQKLQFLLERTAMANAKINETPRMISVPLCEGHLQPCMICKIIVHSVVFLLCDQIQELTECIFLCAWSSFGSNGSILYPRNSYPVSEYWNQGKNAHFYVVFGQPAWHHRRSFFLYHQGTHKHKDIQE